MGGDIGVESQVGAGSTFSFTVQLGRDDEGSAARAESLGLPALRSTLAGRRVLVIGDRATNRRILAMHLASFGAVAVEAPGSAQALHQVTDRSQHFDLAVVDGVLPVLDGVQLATAIRRTPGREQLPVILLASLGRKLSAETVGPYTTVLTKPVRSVPLMQAFARALTARGESPAPSPIPAPTRPREPGSAAATADGSSLRILLAEDNEVNQKVGRLILAKLGYQADIVANGQQALDAVRARDYDVVLMDMHMPVMDGLEATRRIREQLEAARQPVIIAMTASVTMEDREACAAAGMNDYLSKPVRPNNLASMLAGLALKAPSEP